MAALVLARYALFTKKEDLGSQVEPNRSAQPQAPSINPPKSPEPSREEKETPTYREVKEISTILSMSPGRDQDIALGNWQSDQNRRYNDDLIKKFDPDGVGFIDTTKREAYDNFIKDDRKKRVLRAVAAFSEQFDTNRDGTLDEEEYVPVIAILNQNPLNGTYTQRYRGLVAIFHAKDGVQHFDLADQMVGDNLQRMFMVRTRYPRFEIARYLTSNVE